MRRWHGDELTHPTTLRWPPLSTASHKEGEEVLYL